MTKQELDLLGLQIQRDKQREEIIERIIGQRDTNKGRTYVTN